jgi:predicted RNA-binding protein associated with RNAse of E/G family
MRRLIRITRWVFAALIIAATFVRVIQEIIGRPAPGSWAYDPDDLSFGLRVGALTPEERELALAEEHRVLEEQRAATPT